MVIEAALSLVTAAAVPAEITPPEFRVMALVMLPEMASVPALIVVAPL